VGTADVADVQQVAEEAMRKYGLKNAVLYGGSHGGFLACQLVGQYPDFYAAAVTRNPVTHLECKRFISKRITNFYTHYAK
jgi:acylaminoacyl-peptidase